MERTLIGVFSYGSTSSLSFYVQYTVPVSLFFQRASCLHKKIIRYESTRRTTNARGSWISKA